jgi:RNA polymerase sigma-70 factor (ECF subfamily)
MASPSSHSDVTALLQQWSGGDADAFDRASAIVYPELRRIALGYLRRERSSHTLQPTALVNEAFLRFTSMGMLRIDGRRQFYALAAQLMRQILVDHARALNAQKRGGSPNKVPLAEAIGNSVGFAEQFLLVHQALEELKELNSRKAQLIELRYFGGLTLEEAAEQLGMTRTTAHREQRLAEAWLNQRISL